MSATISWRQGTADAIESLDWGQFSFAIGENVRCVEFFDSWKAWEYDDGVAFGDRSELRWKRRAGGAFHLVLIRDDGEKPGEPWVSRDLVRLPPGTAPRRFYLWSEKDGRIPEALSYPALSRAVLPGSQLAIRVQHYEVELPVPEQTESGVEQTTARTRLFRYLRLEGERKR
jgi:hypothetical protein